MSLSDRFDCQEEFTFLDAAKLRALISSLQLTKAKAEELRAIALALETHKTKMDILKKDVDGPKDAKFTVDICSGLLHIVRQAQTSDYDD